MRCPTLGELPAPPPNTTDWPWTEESPQLPDTMPNSSPWSPTTISTPSFNQGQFLEETIRSVLLQGYPNLEYLVMDGGSTDGSIDVIRGYDPWFSYVHIGPDGGQAAAIAEGFRHASGDILAWLNSDDRYRAGALARVASFFTQHPHIVFGNGDVDLVDADGAYVQRIYAIRPNRFLTAHLGVHGWHQQGCFWRRWAYEKAGGIDEMLEFCVDRDLFIRLVATGPSRTIPGKPLADFRIHDRAKSTLSRDVQSRESELIMAKYGDPHLSSVNWLLRVLWWIWCRPSGLRARLDKAFGSPRKQ